LSTFLFTDIEGSTRLWDDHADDMGMALAHHDRLLRAAVEGAGGTVIKTTGDGVLAVFADPVAAVDAAVAAQRRLRAATWGATGPLRVRMALHSGVAEVRDGDYFGPALNRTSRILAIAHGGQIICSAVTAVLAGERLPSSTEMIDLGSHRLRDIDRPEQVYQLVVADLPTTFPPLRSLSTRRSNLPVPLTSFVGRDAELREVATLLSRHRLVTVIGTGGTGKTRLMLEAAGRILDRFPDGVWLAELAALGDPAQIPSEVARALGAPEMAGVPATSTVTAFLADKYLLLLLDNAEHLVDGTATLAERLLAGAPGLRIIATSREALSVPGEAVLQLQSLSCPRADPRDARSGETARTATPATWRTPPRPRPSSCSRSARRQSTRDSHWADRMSPPSPRSAAASTVSLSRSSSPLRGFPRCLPKRSRLGWGTDFDFSPAADGRPSRASRRSTPSSTGAGIS
jgi:class 3 adenylate cyclase